MHVAVADIDSPDPEVKFYRITIRAKSSNVKTDLQTGYFDANAVRRLYGEVKKPAESASAPSKAGTHSFYYNSRKKQWEPANDDQLFTVVFGADAKAIAAEIKTFAESDETGQQIARLMAAAAGREYYIDAVAAEQVSSQEKAKVAALATALKSSSEDAEKLKPDTLTPEELSKSLLTAAQQAVEQLGSTAKLRTDHSTNGFADAKQIYELLKNSKSGK